MAVAEGVMETASQVLIVGDGSGVEGVLHPERFELSLARSWGEAAGRLAVTGFDLLLVDIDGTDSGRLEAVDHATRLPDRPMVVVITGTPSIEEAVEAIRRGAVNYLGKPVDPEALRRVAERARETRRLARDNQALRRLVSRTREGGMIVARSAAMRRVLDKIERVASFPASILISGETGSGKGLVARTLHDSSERSGSPFVHLSCGALQEQLLESELFGYEKGAFTGAVGTKPGLFEAAHSGTLFLDEVAELTAAMQAKLLQVLDSGELRRVGGTALRKVDTRVIAATNKNLKQEVRDDRFRQDLFFRLNVVQIEVPPLRQRRDDIPGLVQQFIDRNQVSGVVATRISRRALALLLEYHWPGNVRELANTIESACLQAEEEAILPADLPAHLQPAMAFESRAIDIPLPLKEMERLHIVRVLDYTGGKKAPAARLLGIDVKTLSNKIRAYEIQA